MKFIITNDDGFGTPGLSALEEACAQLGDVVVVAPHAPCSGIGHRVTTKDSMAIHEMGPSRYALEGTPADCARVGFSVIAPEAEWLIAGINDGGNLGIDVYTSGTVAAAREAASLGLPAVAISQYVLRECGIDWSISSKCARNVFQNILDLRNQKGMYWNINFPDIGEEMLESSLVECPLDPSPHDLRFNYSDGIVEWVGDYHSRPRHSGSDVDVCFGGRISATQLRV